MAKYIVLHVEDDAVKDLIEVVERWRVHSDAVKLTAVMELGNLHIAGRQKRGEDFIRG
jgi:hypothetical protein